MTVNVSTGFRSLLLGPRSFESIFDGGCIEIRTGAQPAHADLAPTGSLIGRITLNGLPWVEGNPTNGLTFTRHGHRVTNPGAPPWVLDGLANGVAGWMRLRPVSDAGLLSTTVPRIDGAVGVPDAPGNYQLILPSTTISSTSAIPITSWWFIFPPLD